MERVTTQRKYLNFSLFLAGLLQPTRQQIAFGFGRMGETIETEMGMSSIQHTGGADVLPGLGPCAHSWSTSMSNFIKAGQVGSWNLIRV